MHMSLIWGSRGLISGRWFSFKYFKSLSNFLKCQIIFQQKPQDHFIQAQVKWYEDLVGNK